MKDTHDTAETQGVLGNTKPKPEGALRSRGWCFTLNNYSDENYELLKTHGHTKCLKYIIGKEIAKTGTPHLQGYLYYKNSRTFDSMKKLMPTAHWAKAKGSPEENLNYCSKEGASISEGFESFKDKIKEKLLNKYKEVEWKDWQQSILNKIKSKPDSRTINWVCDLKGNSGKSFLVKYLALTREIIIADGKKDNIFNQVNKKLNEEEIEFELVILDIPRSSEGYINYGVLEQLKNGLLYSGKYEGGICLFDDVHVIVFANFLPDISQFSEDRWNIIEI